MAIDGAPPVHDHVDAEEANGIALAETLGHAVFSGAFSTGVPFAFAAIASRPTDYWHFMDGFCQPGGSATTGSALTFFAIGTCAGAVFHWLPLRAVAALLGRRTFLILALASLALQALAIPAFMLIWEECSQAYAWDVFALVLVIGALAAAAVAYRFLSTRAETA